jgi:hypothetical protein
MKELRFWGDHGMKLEIDKEILADQATATTKEAAN